MAHGRLATTMFWTGALLALTPVVLGLVIVGVVLHERRKRSRGDAPGEQQPR